MPTPNVRLDTWNRIESYTIHMFLAHRLKITFTSNLKLIISFLVLHNTFIIHLFKSYLLLLRSSMLLTSCTVSRLAQEHRARPSNAVIIILQGSISNKGPINKICKGGGGGEVSLFFCHVAPKPFFCFAREILECSAAHTPGTNFSPFFSFFLCTPLDIS